MRYAKNILETLGDTPLVRLNKVTAGSKALVLAKLEMFNPGGSIKYRIGIAMVEDAERKGLLKPGGTIVEPTSGNTGIGLALVAALRGYKMIFTVPDKQSREKINMLKAFGAKVVVTPTAVAPDHPDSYYKVAERLHKETPNSFLPYQYTNPQNPEAHYRTTGPEIWRDTDGKVTHLVSGMGTGGTISGVGRYLKERNRKVKVIGADPYGSILAELFYRKHGRAYPYKVEGIGEDFLPETTHFQYIDDILKVTDKEAFLTARRLAREEGIFAGGSAGAAVAVAVKVAKDLSKDDLLVVIVPESGDRYLNKVYNDEWMREMGFLEAEEGLPGILSRKGEAGMPAVLTIAAGDTLADAVMLMARHNISQLPVVDNGKVVGSVREDAILAKLVRSPKARAAKVKTVMGKAFPVVPAETDLDAVCRLLERGNSAVLVGTKDRLEGIVTRIDVIQHISRRGAS